MDLTANRLMKPIVEVICLAVVGVVSATAHAHAIKQKVAGYQDSDGLTRKRLGVDMNLDFGQGPLGLSDSTLTFNGGRDTFYSDDYQDDEYLQEVYGSSKRVQTNYGVSSSQTWRRLTETRVLAAYSTDEQVTNRTWGVGVGHWFRHETIRLSIDYSRSIIEQPHYAVLDFDFQEVANPEKGTAEGATLAVRHLATPTTITDYSVGQVYASNRPPTYTGSIGIRQFIPPIAGAVHGTVQRAYNRGEVGTDTNYGQVDAWIFDLAYLQELWQGATSRLGYRQYRENETTRALEDERVLGSDAATLGLAQEFGPAIEAEIVGARYANNDDVTAQSYELGLTAKF